MTTSLRYHRTYGWMRRRGHQSEIGTIDAHYFEIDEHGIVWTAINWERGRNAVMALCTGVAFALVVWSLLLWASMLYEMTVR